MSFLSTIGTLAFIFTTFVNLCVIPIFLFHGIVLLSVGFNVGFCALIGIVICLLPITVGLILPDDFEPSKYWAHLSLKCFAALTGWLWTDYYLKMTELDPPGIYWGVLSLFVVNVIMLHSFRPLRRKKPTEL